MLQRLKIKNIALISQSDIEFEEGLNILSGETGAGKSLIIDSLNFVLGARADKTLIKHGEDFASVDAVFSISEITPEVNEFFNLISSDPETTIIISRTMNQSGKTDIRVNGQTVTGSMLKKLTPLLVDIHGQHAHQALLDEKNHLGILDAFDSKKTQPLLTNLSEHFEIVKQINEQIAMLGGLGADRERNMDLLQYQIQEIETAGLREQEEEQLLQQKAVLLHAEKISQSLTDACGALTENDPGAVQLLKLSLQQLKPVCMYDPTLAQKVEKLENLYYELLDQSDQLSQYAQSVVYDEDELNKIEQRLDTIKQLKRKYGAQIADIEQFLSHAKQSLYDLQHAKEQLEILTAKKQEQFDSLRGICHQLTTARKAIATTLSEQIIRHLLDLGIKHPCFEVVFAPKNEPLTWSDITHRGADEIEFMFSANLGEPVKPLAKIISGGEMSRFMLAMKCVINENNNKTFIFDEIDNGIGGTTGTIVAQKLSTIAKRNQIICVTHLAQIASFADLHFNISKTEQDEKTKTIVTKLTEQGIELEIARLLGAEHDSAVGVLHAKELLALAKKYKTK